MDLRLYITVKGLKKLQCIMVCGHIKDSYQPGHLPSLIKVFNGDQWIAENQMFLRV